MKYAYENQKAILSAAERQEWFRKVEGEVVGVFHNDGV